ncbi:MAG: geranylgeranylglyceryl/heptaprenylglyceryl phosphate synthase [Ignavibacteriaceae bacterium]|nr:geranylgeranylglyceryl/heptaprenylglyceryl phosphate synthase [Ignavibacteriaceae bacterium]
MNIYYQLLEVIKVKGAAYLVLLDPDNLPEDKVSRFAKHCEESGVDGFLVGGSLLLNDNLESFLVNLKKVTSLPAIIFPGDVNQISSKADAILYLSVVSGRNPEHLIGKHVLAAPIIKKCGIEPIATGYLLIESGRTTTAQYMSGSLPIPRNKPGIAAATALAAEYLGMKLIYLEAGSGADNPIPNEMVKTVSSLCTVPVVVGGGIKTEVIAKELVENGAKIIVTGNFFEDETNWNRIKDFANAVHFKLPVFV